VAIALLKWAAIELRSRHVRRDGVEGGRIGRCARGRHDEIARARAARGECSDRAMRHAEVGVGHVPGGLLVAWRNQLDPVLAFPQSIQQADVAVAADAEDVGNAFLDQEIADQICAFHARHGAPPVHAAVCLSVKCYVAALLGPDGSKLLAGENEAQVASARLYRGKRARSARAEPQSEWSPR